MPVVIVDDKEWFYEIIGEGAPCIIVGIASCYLHALPARLKKVFRFICCDFNWTNANLPLSRITTLTMRDMILLYEQLRKALGLSKIFMMGHSRPAWLAHAYASAFPEHTLGVLMLHPPAIWIGNESARSWHAENYFKQRASVERQRLRYKNRQQLIIKTPRNAMQSFVASYLADAPFYWADPYFDASFFWHGPCINFPLFAYYSDNMLAQYAKRMPQENLTIKNKLLIILGAMDYSIPVVDWQSALCPIDPKCIKIAENSGHYVLKEQQAWAEYTILSWKMSLKEHHEKCR